MILHIRNGQITNPAALERHIKDMDGIYSLELKARNHRSKNQNDYFHSVVLEYVLEGLKDAGYNSNSKDQAKNVVKMLFLKTKIKDLEIIKDTSDLTKEEFSYFIDQIGEWSKEYLNTSIPPPDYQLSII